MDHRWRFRRSRPAAAAGLLLVVLLASLGLATTSQARTRDELVVHLRPLQSFPGTWLGFRQLTGDVDGDGRTDLIWNHVDSGGNNLVIVALSNGDGSFDVQPTQTIPSSYASFQTYTGDFNGDGRTDLLWNSKCQGTECQDGTNNYVVIALALGDGTFEKLPGQWLGTGWSRYDTFVGDVNGDGRDDVVFNSVGNGGHDDNTGVNFIYTATSSANGFLTLSPLQTVGLEGWDYFNPLVGDVNGDGRADLIWITLCPDRPNEVEALSCWQAANNRVVVGLSNGDTFDVLAPQPVGADGVWDQVLVFWGDVNGDGRLDLVWHSGSGVADPFIQAGLGQASGQFEVYPSQPFTEYGDSILTRLLDVDGDGRLELLLNSICQFRAGDCLQERTFIRVADVSDDGIFAFESWQELPASELTSLGLYIRHPAADYDGDGRHDLFWSSLDPNFSGFNNVLLVGLTGEIGYELYTPVVVK